MQPIKIAIALLALSSCAKQCTEIDPTFKDIVDKFTADTGASVTEISIKFGDLSKDTLAICKTDGSDRYIIVNVSLWFEQDDSSKEEIIYHELGHCILNRRHNNDLLPNGCPKSIMYSYSFGNTLCYKNNVYYYKELKGE